MLSAVFRKKLITDVVTGLAKRVGEKLRPLAAFIPDECTGLNDLLAAMLQRLNRGKSATGVMFICQVGMVVIPAMIANFKQRLAGGGVPPVIAHVTLAKQGALVNDLACFGTGNNKAGCMQSRLSLFSVLLYELFQDAKKTLLQTEPGKLKCAYIKIATIIKGQADYNLASYPALLTQAAIEQALDQGRQRDKTATRAMHSVQICCQRLVVIIFSLISSNVLRMVSKDGCFQFGIA